MMQRYKSPQVRSRAKASGTPNRRGLYPLLLILLVSFDSAAVLAYLWGRVQIDFAVRQNDKLLEQRRRIQDEIDQLSVRIDNLKSYQRIASLAKTQGLLFVPSERLEDLPVDLRGMRAPDTRGADGFALAGMALFESVGAPTRRDDVR